MQHGPVGIYSKEQGGGAVGGRLLRENIRGGGILAKAALTSPAEGKMGWSRITWEVAG